MGKVWQILVWLIVSGLMAMLHVTPLLAQPGVTVHFEEQANVTGRDILLQDVAHLEGPEDAVDRIGQVVLGRAPLPGLSRGLTVGQILVRLRQAGFDPRALQLTGAEQIQVRTVPPTMDAPSQPDEASGEDSLVPLVVADRPLSRGDVLAEADLRVELREVRGLVVNSGLVADYVGQQATAYIREGTVISQRMLEVPPVIQRGSSVWILSEVAGIRVSAPGVARASGGIGERIAVENTVSRQVIYGEILNHEYVRVSVERANMP